MTQESSTDSAGATPTRRRLSRRVRWIIAVIVVIVIAPLAWIGIRAYIAYDALINAEQDVHSLQNAASSGQLDGLPYIYADMRSNTGTAASLTSDPIWRAAEHLPVAGPNMAAVRAVAATINSLVVDGVGPLASSTKGLDFSQFRPVNGKVNMTKVESFVPAVDAAYQGVAAAQRSANAIDTTHTLGPITGAVTQFRVLVQSGVVEVGGVRKLVRQLPAALGSEGPRNYLVVLGTNAQDRSNGGAPVALSLLRVERGHFSIIRTATAADLSASGPPSVSPLASLAPFSKSDSLLDIDRSPVFPVTASALAKAWTARYAEPVDSVISTDTTGLGYLAGVTGPVSVGGKSLPAADIGAYLSTGADGASAADLASQESASLRSVLSGLIAGAGDTRSYLGTAEQLVDEKRLLFWSSDKGLQALVVTSPLSGTISASNAKVTSWGLYFNDPSTAAVSTSLSATAVLSRSGCSAPGAERSTLSVTMTSALKTAALTEDVIVYGPVDFHYSGFTLTGGTLISSHVATVSGHPVEAFRVHLISSKPGTLEVRHREGGPPPSSTVEVRSSPRWQVTALTLAPCS